MMLRRKLIKNEGLRRSLLFSSSSSSFSTTATTMRNEEIRYTSRNEEQFQLISVLRGKLMRDRRMHVKEAFLEMDRLIKDYIAHDPKSGSTPELCELAPLLSKYGAFFTDLPLSGAYYWYNKRHRFGKRRHVRFLFSRSLSLSHISLLSSPFRYLLPMMS